MDEPMSPDLLSDLPLGIIHIILSFVPIRDAVRTSLLAKQWRYIWSSLPQLAFNDNSVINDTSGEKLFAFINQTLLLHEGSIHKFELYLSVLALSRVQCQCIDQWLLFLSRNNIRILVLGIPCDNYSYCVHSSLYSFQYLTHLSLYSLDIPPLPPSFKGFLFLRFLCLCMVEKSSTAIENIVAYSPLLESLMLEYYPHEMTIRAPNLKYFHFDTVSGHLSLDTPLLEKLNGEFFLTPRLSFHESSVFRRLRIIKLSSVPFDRTDVTMGVIFLITRSPNLLNLEISSSPSGGFDAPEIACASFWDTEFVPEFTYDSLKIIKMMNFGCEIDEMKLIKFLLARSPVLERLIHKPDSSLSYQELLNLEAELLSYPRASTNVEIVIDN